MSTASLVREIPETKSPKIKSRIPDVKATPGTSDKTAPTIIMSRFFTKLIWLVQANTDNLFLHQYFLKSQGLHFQKFYLE